MQKTWFLFDLGNTLIKLAYERVLAGLCGQATMGRDDLVELLEDAGGYRDLERGLVTFAEFHEFLRDKAGYRGSLREFRKLWGDFFDGPIGGMEDLLERIRARYRVAFLSNSNEVHAEEIPKKFPTLFRDDDRFVFSYRFRVAKPDPEMFQRALEVLGTTAGSVVFIDDLAENVTAAIALGIQAYQFTDAERLEKDLVRDGLL
jgi:glucose-1-phosphatase